jgi:hypothetical protein
MLKQLPQKFLIDAVVDQIIHTDFDKRIYLNETSGDLFSGTYTIKPEFIGTPIGNLLEQLGDIGEARLLKLKSGDTYTAHTDPDDRIHLAILTNKYSYLFDLDEERMYHVPVDGHLYEMDTSKVHIAANFGGDDRVHLNIRVKLPAFKNPGFRLVFSGVNDPDWKQRLFIDVMGYLNRAIKQNTVRGIAKISDVEWLLNCDQSVLDYIVDTTRSRGFEVVVTAV